MQADLYREMGELESRFWWFVAKRNIVLRLIERYLDPKATQGGRRPKAIDIGCGCGATLKALAERYDAEGMDPSPLAREFCAKRGLRVADGTLPDGLPFEPGQYDIAIMTDVLEHVEPDAASARAVAATLRQGGILVCTVPAHRWMWTARDDAHHHKRRYTRAQYRAIFEGAGLREELVGWYNSALFPAMAAARVASRALGLDKKITELKVPPAPINGALRMVFESEKHLLGRVPFPAGASLVSVHRRVEPVSAKVQVRVGQGVGAAV